MIRLTSLFLFLITSFLFFSCQSDKDKELISDCDGLAMMYYRGLPKPAKLYKDHCSQKESQLEYSPLKCKNALGQLMLHGSAPQLKKQFGKRIMECFNEADLERFLKTKE
jgi:hypothetical protein